jgi:uncharacterized membrane protein YgdD (TMEM256/DUF423 family)
MEAQSIPSSKERPVRRLAFAAAALAGIAGALGVALAAASAHLTSDPRLEKAAFFLLFHAASALGSCALALAAPARPRWFIVAAACLLGGSLLFAGDLSLRTLAGAKLFPMAAPIGGLVLIGGWILTAAAGIAAAAEGAKPQPKEQ